MGDFLNPYELIERHGSKLPHWQQGEAMQFVTFRLGDAMPAEKLKQWREDRGIWLDRNPEPWSIEQERLYHRIFTRQIEEWLDAGMGSCLLRAPEVRGLIEDVLQSKGETYAVHHAWVLMPNHVHLLFTPRHPLDALMKAWKGASARRIGRGPIWQRGYRDTLIRDEEHFENAVRYIRRNPEKLSEGTFSLWQSERALEVP